jgi:hypothetical protein
MLISCLVVMFAEMLAVKVVNLFVVTNYFELCIIRAVIYTLGVNALLAVIAFYEGYRDAKAHPVSVAASGVIATLIHSLFALLFNFEAFCAGGVRSIAALVKFGKAIDSELFIGTLTKRDLVIFFFINSAIYISVMIVANIFGARYRQKERQRMNVVLTHSDQQQ